MSGNRDFDVVIWGASGFVGKLLCERLAKKYQGEVRWAMAGRNKEKLEGVRSDVAAVNGVAKDTEILIGDIQDAASMRAIARRTKVIIAMAGPFAKLGTPVVEACLAESTHYVDITGESWWIRRLLDAGVHEQAAQKGIRIVPCCGYDSIPSDIGAWFVVDHIKRTLGKPTKSVRMLTVGGSGGIGGGTIDSLLGVRDISSEERHAVGNPYCLSPPDKRTGADGRDQRGVGWVPELQQRTIPFVMAPINTRVVRRSGALLGDEYGPNFSYNEATPAPRPGIVMAPLLVGALGVGFGALLSPGLGSFIRNRLLPAANTGPDESVREGGHWRNIYLATPEGETQATVQAEGYGTGDPGYGSTHRMVLEAALCLALQLEDCEAAGRAKGGILTPASAMGPVLLDRLRRHGQTYFAISPSVGAYNTIKPSQKPSDIAEQAVEQSKM